MTLEKVGAQKGENCKISRLSQFVHKILTIKFKADQLDRVAGDCDGYRTIPCSPNHKWLLLACVYNQFYDVDNLRFGCICEIEIVFGNCEYHFVFSPVFLTELFVTDSEYISSDNSRLDLHNFCTNAPENDSSL